MGGRREEGESKVRARWEEGGRKQEGGWEEGGKTNRIAQSAGVAPALIKQPDPLRSEVRIVRALERGPGPPHLPALGASQRLREVDLFQVLPPRRFAPLSLSLAVWGYDPV